MSVHPVITRHSPAGPGLSAEHESPAPLDLTPPPELPHLDGLLAALNHRLVISMPPLAGVKGVTP